MANEINYTYSQGTDLKGYPYSGGSLAFDGSTTEAQLVTLFTDLDGLLVPGVKMQVSKKVKWHFDRSLPSQLKDMAVCRMRLKNKTDKNVDISMVLPYVLPEYDTNGDYDAKATRNKLETWAESFLAKKPAVRNKDGTFTAINVCKVYVPESISVSRASDVTQSDSKATGDTPS